MNLYHIFYRLKSKLAGLIYPSAGRAYVDSSVNTLHGYRVFGDQAELMTPSETVSEAESPGNKFILNPGFYMIEDQIFDLRQDGVYRFYKLPKLSRQYIVCTQGLESLLKMTGYLWKYGNADDVLPVSKLYEKMQQGSISTSCGKTALLMSSLCTELGYQNRLISCLTLNAWSGQDDGHFMIELQDQDGKWFLYDPSFHAVFDSAGQRLSASAFSQTPMEEIDIIHTCPHTGSYAYAANGYDYAFWVERRLLNPQALKDWYADIKHVCAIQAEDIYYCALSSAQETDKERVSGFFTILPERDFVEKFYTPDTIKE